MRVEEGLKDILPRFTDLPYFYEEGAYCCEEGAYLYEDVVKRTSTLYGIA